MEPIGEGFNRGQSLLRAFLRRGLRANLSAQGSHYGNDST
jgi:hypothetical protein